MAEFATIAQVKSYLGLNSSTDDPLLMQIIKGESALMANWMSREFEVATHVDTFDGNGKTRRMLSSTPVVSVAAVTIGGVPVPAAISPQGTGYILIDNVVALVGGYAFHRGSYNCQITYTAGYDEVPDDVQQACIELVAQRYRAKDRIGLISKGLAGETTTYEIKALPDHVKLILQQYRRVAP